MANPKIERLLMTQKMSVSFLPLDLKRDSVPEKGNGYSAVVSNASLDRFDLLLTVEHRFPRVKMPYLVEITSRYIGIFFKTDHIEDIIPVGNLPGVDISSILLAMIPKIKRVHHR